MIKIKCIFVVLFLMYATTSQSQPEQLMHHYCGKHIRDSILCKSSNASPYNLVYHRLEWEVDPAVVYIKGKITSHFIAEKDGLSQLAFDLVANLQVDSIVYHNQSISFRHNGDTLQCILPQPIAAGAKDSIAVHYQGEPGREAGFGAFRQGYHDGVPIIWTLSEPYGAKQWWCCKQSLDDKIDSTDILVKTPVDYRVASNGVLVNEVVRDTIKTTHWKHKHPIAAYLIAIAVTNYVEYSEYVPMGNGDSIQILNYVYPENLEYAKKNTAQTIDIMQLYNQLFIPYPFYDEKYGHAQFGWSGGMEHQTMSFMGYFSFFLIAHELAHQWFGDYITCGSWQDIWLNEGFAVYLEGLTCEHGVATTDWNAWKRGKINYITAGNTGSVYVDDTTSVYRIFDGRLTYAKAGMVLHTIRWHIGDSAFFSAIRNYLTDPELINGYALTKDLQHHFEQTSNKNIDELFADWVYGSGFPVYEIYWKQEEDNNLQITVHQSQSDTTQDFFEMLLPVQISGKNIDSLLILEHTYSGQVFNIQPNARVDDLLFDPNHEIITRNPVVLKIDPEFNSYNIRVMPNPADNILRIQTVKPLFFEEIAIYNMTGAKVKTIIPESYFTEKEINIENMQTGTYIIEFRKEKTSGYSGMKKILIR